MRTTNGCPKSIILAPSQLGGSLDLIKHRNKRAMNDIASQTQNAQNNAHHPQKFKPF